MDDNQTVVSAKKMMDARHDKQVKGFHKNLMSDIGNGVSTMSEALKKHRDAGTFDGYEPGTRLLGKTGNGPAPFKIEGHSVTDWNKAKMAHKAFESKGVTPTLIEHGGKQWLPMLNTSTGNAPPPGKDDDGAGEWSRGQAYLDLVKAAGYPKMGIK